MIQEDIKQLLNDYFKDNEIGKGKAFVSSFLLLLSNYFFLLERMSKEERQLFLHDLLDGIELRKVDISTLLEIIEKKLR